MNVSDTMTDEHPKIWELIPWMVNGRLNEADLQRAQGHLRLCGACRDEYSTQQQVYQILAVNTAIEQMPMSGLNKLRQRIDGAEFVAKQPAKPLAAVARHLTPRQPESGGQRRLPAPVIAAAAVVISLMLGVAAAVHWSQTLRPDGPAGYTTVNAAVPLRARAVVRAVFAPTLTLSGLQAVLDDARLRIISGPTEAGVYSLAMTGASSVEGSLQRLRAHDTVRFAEVIGPSGVSDPAH